MSESTRKKKPNRGQFQAGRSGNPSGRPKEPVLSSEVEDDLAAMEWVWSHGPGEDRTHQHRSFRALKDASPAGFWDRMQELRKAKAPQSAAPDGTTGQTDQGTARARQALREWLEKNQDA